MSEILWGNRYDSRGGTTNYGTYGGSQWRNNPSISSCYGSTDRSLSHRLTNYTHSRNNQSFVGRSTFGYRPENQQEMQRKIAELERSLAMMRSSSRQLSENLNSAERKVWELDQETKSKAHLQDLARYSQSRNIQDEQSRLEMEIMELRTELRKLHDISRKVISENQRLTERIDNEGDGSEISDGGDEDLTEWGRRQLGHRSSGGRHKWKSSEYEFADTVVQRNGNRSIGSPCSVRSAHTSPHRCGSPCSSPRRCATELDCTSNGYRSILTKPIVTQRNKVYLYPTGVSTRRGGSLFSSPHRRIFVPRSPADLSIHDVVEFTRQGSTDISKGRVKFIGHLHGRGEAFIGVELQHELGDHDGVYRGYRYYQCKPSRGLFIPFDRIALATSEEEWNGSKK